MSAHAPGNGVWGGSPTAGTPTATGASLRRLVEHLAGPGQSELLQKCEKTLANTTFSLPIAEDRLCAAVGHKISARGGQGEARKFAVAYERLKQNSVCPDSLRRALLECLVSCQSCLGTSAASASVAVERSQPS
eukprot:RCo002958